MGGCFYGANFRPSQEIEAIMGGGQIFDTGPFFVRLWYKNVWDAAIGEELSCQREPDNCQDPFAVAVIRSQVTVGHIPRRISSICSMFLRRGSS